MNDEVCQWSVASGKKGSSLAIDFHREQPITDNELLTTDHEPLTFFSVVSPAPPLGFDFTAMSFAFHAPSFGRA